MPRPVHFEIHASDPEASREFYSRVFGWTFDQWENNPYWIVSTHPEHEHTDEPHEHEPGIDGGLMPREDGPDGQRINAWVTTVTVDDADACIQSIRDAGGSVAVPAQDLPGVGRFAYVLDPDGNMFGVLQPEMG